MPRREELEAGMPAPQVIIKMKTGVKRDGQLMALEAEAILESGAYSGAVPPVGGLCLASLYLWPNFDVKGFEVLTHKPSIAAYRAPVAPQTIFAIDSQMEQIAKAIGVDPVEFRLRHLQREGDKMANNQPWLSNGAVEVLTRLAEHPLWKKRAEWKASSKDGRLRGTGLSLAGCRTRASRSRRSARRATSTCRRWSRSSALATRPSRCRRPRSAPSSRGSRSIPTPAR